MMADDLTIFPYETMMKSYLNFFLGFFLIDNFENVNETLVLVNQNQKVTKIFENWKSFGYSRFYNRYKISCSIEMCGRVFT